MLHTSKVIKITDIVHAFDVSNETARRDLETLQDQMLVKRVYGGAVLIAPPSHNTFERQLRRSMSYAEKVAIGKAAASLVNKGETIMLDTGSTTLQVARHLKHIENIIVLTNSLHIINEFANSNVTLYILGGKLNSDESTMVGNITAMAAQKFFVDKAFIGAGGVTFAGGVTDYSDELYYRQIVLAQANQAILVADSGKFGINALSFVCKLDQINTIVSDTNLSSEYIDGINERKIDLILAEPQEENGA